MSEPSISVVIPTFNRRELCLRAVASALAQTHPPHEVIVCDDGSTDDTKEAFEAMSRADRRVRYLELARSGTPAGPRNRGAAAARGDWVAFLDDDDEWLPAKLATQAPLLGSGHSIICGNARGAGGVPYFSPAADNLTFGRRELLRDNQVITSTALVPRKELLDAGGFPEKRRYASVEDHGAWLRLADRGATGVRIPDVLALYRTVGADRLSARGEAPQRALASLALSRWATHPLDPALAAAAAVQSGRAAKLTLRAVARRLSTARSSTSS